MPYICMQEYTKEGHPVLGPDIVVGGWRPRGGAPSLSWGGPNMMVSSSPESTKIKNVTFGS